jgi:6-pyruvoyltetrahydropterin/6-carboxytetrahydropterin synthase
MIESNIEMDALLECLDRLLKEQVVEPLDHSFLNHDVEHFANVVPTSENIALWLRERLRPALDELGVRLECLRLYESDDLYAEVDG